MTVIYSNTLKDTRMQAVVTAVDGGGAAGTMEIGSAGFAAVLAVITLQRPSFSEASQTITVLGVPLSGNATSNGTAALARIKDSNGNIIISGLTVGTGGTDILISTTTLTTGLQLSLVAGTIMHG